MISTEDCARREQAGTDQRKPAKLTQATNRNDSNPPVKHLNKLDKPYKRLQSQGQDHIKKWPSVVASLMLIACLVAERMQR